MRLLTLILLSACTSDGQGGDTDASNPASTVADAGPDQTVGYGERVVLDGQASVAADGTTLTSWAWTLTDAPADAGAALVDGELSAAAFRPDAYGTYTAQLVVTDSAGGRAEDEVVIEVAPPALEPGQFDPSQVHFVGYFAGGQYDYDVVFSFDDLSRGAICLPYSLDHSLARLGADGTLFYGRALPVAFACDGDCVATDTDSCPTDYGSNDVVGEDPCATSGDTSERYHPGADGTMWHYCGTSAGEEDWREVGGAQALVELDWHLDRVGTDGRGLVWTGSWDPTAWGVVDLETGVVSPGAIPNGRSLFATRAIEGGAFFLATTSEGPETWIPELWQIDADGTTTRVGGYSDIPWRYYGGFESVLDAAGALISDAEDTSTYHDVILRRTLDGRAEVLWDEQDEPPSRYETRGLVTGP